MRRWRAIAAIKGEVQEGGQIDEEGIGKVLRLIEDKDGGNRPLIDQVQQAFVEAGPEFGAAMGGAEAELQGQGPVEIKGPQGGTQIEHEVVGFGELGAEMAQCGLRQRCYGRSVWGF